MRERRLVKGASWRTGVGRVRTETFSASCEDYFLPAEGGGAGGFFSDGAMAGAGDVEAGVDPCDFMTSMILVRSVASLVKGDFG